jgi:hypothetical protein
MIPLELMHEIIGHLSADVDAETLRACALVSPTWLDSARLRLFEQVTLDSVESWRNLSDLLSRTPHLVSYVHRLVISNEMSTLRGFLHHSVRDEADPDVRTCLGRQLSGVQELHLRCIPFRFRHEIAQFFEFHFLEVVSLRMETADIGTSDQLRQCYLAPRRALRSLCLLGVMVFEKNIRLCLASYDSLTVDGLALSIPSDLAMTPNSQKSAVRYLHASSIQPENIVLLANCIHRVATSLEIVTVTTNWVLLSNPKTSTGARGHPRVRRNLMHSFVFAKEPDSHYSISAHSEVPAPAAVFPRMPQCSPCTPMLRCFLFLAVRPMCLYSNTMPC